MQDRLYTKILYLYEQVASKGCSGRVGWAGPGSRLQQGDKKTTPATQSQPMIPTGKWDDSIIYFAACLFLITCRYPSSSARRDSRPDGFGRHPGCLRWSPWAGGYHATLPGEGRTLGEKAGSSTVQSDIVTEDMFALPVITAQGLPNGYVCHQSAALTVGFREEATFA